MQVLLETSFPRTLDTLLARYGQESCREMRLEAWLFEDTAARRAAEQVLAGFGVQAVLRSAYKPLLHALLEEADLVGLASVTIRTPIHPAGSALRFQVEAYPLAALLPGVALRFEPGADPLDHAVTLEHADGRRQQHRVFAPNRVMRDHLGEDVLAACGWLRVWHPGSAVPHKDGPLETEYEAVFHAVMATLAKQDWGATLPLFPALEIAVHTGGIEHPLPWQDEVISTREALHEEFYFAAIELFQQRAGHAKGSRGLQFGQVIPDIHPATGATTVRVTVGAPDTPVIAPDAGEALEAATQPLSPDRIAAELSALGGARFDATSVLGRPVPAAYFPAEGPGLLVSAGQHANETSGVVGALRAAQVLLARGVNFALIPQENPDGYALHHRLRAAHPRHMHHAARYSALGDDIQHRTAEPLHEAAARHEAIRRTGARLHLNLHGYPAHEWTRPLTGYLPRGFGLWTIPKGFFLIMRHAPGLAEIAEAFTIALAARVAEVPGLAAFNARHIAACEAHAGKLDTPVHHGIPCTITAYPDAQVPFTLITEYPDETIYGDAFRLAHTVQMATVLAAAELFTASDGLQRLVVRSRHSLPECRVNRPTTSKDSGENLRTLPSDFHH
jgi:hypothetical protein